MDAIVREAMRRPYTSIDVVGRVSALPILRLAPGLRARAWAR